MAVRNFAHHAKPQPQEATKEFRTLCEIFLCTNSVRFLSSDILCKFLVSPLNNLDIFFYIFLYILEVTSYIRRETEGERYVVFHKTLVRKSLVVRNIQSLCSTFPSHFVFIFLSSQTTSEDDFSRDEWLGFTFLGVMEDR